MAAIQGDWYASRSTHDGEAYPQIDDTVRFVYATQPSGEKYIVAKVWSDDDGDYEGTARLISAAPELLSQLKVAADFISGHNECLSVPSGSGDRQWNDYCIGLLEDCKAAIDKAEGRGE